MSSEITVTEEQETPQLRNKSDNLFSIKDYDDPKVRLTSIEQKQSTFVPRFQSSNNVQPNLKHKVVMVDQYLD